MRKVFKIKLNGQQVGQYSDLRKARYDFNCRTMDACGDCKYTYVTVECYEIDNKTEKEYYCSTVFTHNVPEHMKYGFNW